MTVQLKLRQIVTSGYVTDPQDPKNSDFIVACRRVGSKVPQKTAYLLAKVLREARDILSDFHESREMLVERFSRNNSEGKLVYDERLLLDQEKRELGKEMNTLLDSLGSFTFLESPLKVSVDMSLEKPQFETWEIDTLWGLIAWEISE